MNTRSEKKDLRDQEIIDLTEVVEEPPHGTPPGDLTPGGHNFQEQERTRPSDSAENKSAGQNSGTEEDDFDFSALLDDSEEAYPSPGVPGHADSSRSKNRHRSSQTSGFDGFEDIEDLFDELELGLSAQQTTGSSPSRWSTSDPAEQYWRDNSDDPQGQTKGLDALQALESRVHQLEEAIASGNRESWKDIESRIMSRLEHLVQEYISEAKKSLQQDIESAFQAHLSSQQSGDVQELAQKIEEMQNYAVGPETVSALKNELWTELNQRIEESVPQAAATIIREEIQALMDEEKDSGPVGPEE